jgi:hypothetical protein
VPLPTDSVTGELVDRLPDAFVLRTDEGETIVLQLPPETVEARHELYQDSVRRPVPHTTVMGRRDVLFALEQLMASDERARIHVHYVRVDGHPVRRVAVWISIARARLPAG